MRKHYTDITLVLDRSGSMWSIQEAAIEMANSFVEKNKVKAFDDELVKFTWVQFDADTEDWYRVEADAKLINEVPVFTKDNFVPRGGTALNDAIGRTIDNLGKRLSNLAEHDRPDKVLVAIVTDGGENSSKIYTKEQSAGMIAHQKDKYQWEFVFMGANQNSFATAKTFNIPQGNVMNFTASVSGVDCLTKHLNASNTLYKAGLTRGGEYFSNGQK